MTDAVAPQPHAGYTLRFEDRPGYTRAHVVGERDTVEISLAYWTEIARHCHEHAVHSVLVVEEIAERAAMLDVYEVASGLVALGFSDIRIAFVDLNTDELPLMQFGETVARNRGIDGRVFAREADAEAWLTHEWAGDGTARQRGG